ncbi:transcriptional regulator, LysR family [Pelagibacterium halotolerans B2]|uniref:Transcriptional regulator, LysR family n=2 Tax=Pelagibacterium TaxID=1082930 RepID=G4REQ8_PELHB|nr:transcriptional regulator, LysR family [Pelagibacterium halotolerans B2]QJR20630.1 LysR family transcriptional regulator [Pelagibacterium halotolerans]
MNAHGFDWNQMRAFLATIEAGSLSAAARALGLTQPTLSRQIAALEDDLGLLLFERVGRRLTLTEAGRRLAEQVRAMGAAADRIAITASSQSQALEGRVRITAVDILVAHVLPPVLETLYAIAPGIEIEIIASNSIDDLMRREADIAIRHVQPDHEDLIARRCRDTEVALYAASSFLEKFGRPIQPSDLAEAPFIGFAPDDSVDQELNRRGIPVTRGNFRWLCVSSLVGLELIRRGLGIGLTFADAADQFPDLERVLPDMEPLRAPVWLTVHRELRTSPRMRIVFDALAESFGSSPDPSRAAPGNPD